MKHRRRIAKTWSWLAEYDGAALRGDLMAGVAVGVMLVPQAMAYALVAGVPPVYGLYASLVPLLVYPLVGGAKRLAVGIVALDMLVVGTAIDRLGVSDPAAVVSVALALTALVGVIHLAFGLLRLGFMAEWLSRPVTSGFMIAAPILIALSQLDALLGVEVERGHPAVMLWSLFGAIPETNVWAAAIGGGGIVLLTLAKRFAPRLPRALLVVGLSTLAVALWKPLEGAVPVIGSFEGGLPRPQLPVVDLALARDLVGAAVTLALLQLMVTVTLARGLAEKGDDVRPNRELAALGSANLVGSFFGALPVSASISRTAVNADAGARSPLANLFAAGVVALALVALPEVFAYVPMAALAAIIIASTVTMIDLEEPRKLFGVRRFEGWLAVGTLLTTLLVGIQEGLLLGVGTSMAHLLYRQSRPNVATLGRTPGGEYRDRAAADDATPLGDILVLRVDAPITFANADWLQRTLREKVLAEEPRPTTLVIDGRGINLLDATGADALVALAEELEDAGVRLALVNLNAEVRAIIDRSGAKDELAQHVMLSATLLEALDALQEENPLRAD
jgi:SulP family sulfate permease